MTQVAECFGALGPSSLPLSPFAGPCVLARSLPRSGLAGADVAEVLGPNKGP